MSAAKIINKQKRKRKLLNREEYIEQEFFFHSLRERMDDYATQELLKMLVNEILNTTRLVMAVDFMATEMFHKGTISSAMALLPHYFTPYQAFIMAEAEKEEGRFDFRVGLEILEYLAKYYAQTAVEGERLPVGVKPVSAPGIFFYEIEAISRNRLSYERGLDAMQYEPIFSPAFSKWTQTVRRQLGFVDLASLIYVRSEYYLERGGDAANNEMLFGRKEGQIALANRRKDMTFLFSALQRQLGYPKVPHTMYTESEETKIILLQERVALLETRIRLLEEEKQHGGINLTNFYKKEQ